MVRRIFASGVLAGLAAGGVAAALQAATTTPLILQAELFETARAAAGHVHAAAEHAHAAAEGLTLARFALSSLATLIFGVGFALILVALMALAGEPVDARRGALWGLAGFAAASLAPALGLPPELPGSAAADLAARQAWWVATVSCTGVGLWLILLKRRTWAIAAGAALLLLPHLWGAPEGQGAGTAPPELAARFAVLSLAVAALFWTLIGALGGVLYRRFA
jgi:cobalt transporter subunit CbtA